MDEMATLNQSPHRRFNPLTGEWVLVSPHRTLRPWQGKQEETEGEQLPAHDPDCYLCPGNTRAGGEVNPDYEDTFVFTNDFSALLPESSGISFDDGLFRAEAETGICRVICFSPRHDLSLSRMKPEKVERVITLWQDEYAALGGRDDIGYVQIFENRGAVMGCSNPHPHGQIWATRSVPSIPAAETRSQKGWAESRGSCLLCDYLERERTDGERIVFENNSFTVLVPFWAVWPYEVMVLPRRHMGSILELTGQEKAQLADALVRLGVRYDNLFKTSFPYSMGLHQQPSDGEAHPEWHWHMHYYPPLLRSATVKKFMVGYEMMALPQRDLTAEQAAALLRELSETHFVGAGK